MSLSRTKKAYLNMIAEGTYQVTVLVCGLILPRYILKYYGSAYNGMISAITQLLSFISILRMGVAGATRVELYKSLGNNDNIKTSGIVKATQLFMHKIAIVLCVYIFILMIAYPLWVIVWGKSEYSWINIASLVLIIGLGVFAEYFFGITYSTLLDSNQELYVYTWIRTISTIINLGLSILLIINGVSIQIVKLFSCIVFALCPIFLSFYVPKKYQLNKNADPDKSALNQRGDVMASSIANIVHDNTDVIVLTLLTNPLVVSVYSVYNLVMNGLRKVVGVFTSGLEALFGNMWVKNETDKLYNGLRRFEYFIAVFNSCVFSVTMVLILPFVKLYTKGVTDIDYIIPSYAVLVVIAQAAFCFRQPYLTFVQAAGHYKQTKIGAFIEAGMNIVLSVAFTFKFGIIGVVIGTLAANVFRSMQYAYYISKHLLPRPFIQVVLKIIWTTVNMVASIVLSELILSNMNIEISDWKSWIIAGIISVTISVMLCFIMSYIFYRSDLKWLIRRTFGVLKKKG